MSKRYAADYITEAALRTASRHGGIDIQTVTGESLQSVAKEAREKDCHGECRSPRREEFRYDNWFGVEWYDSYDLSVLEAA